MVSTVTVTTATITTTVTTAPTAIKALIPFLSSFMAAMDSESISHCSTYQSCQTNYYYFVSQFLVRYMAYFALSMHKRMVVFTSLFVSLIRIRLTQINRYINQPQQ